MRGNFLKIGLIATVLGLVVKLSRGKLIEITGLERVFGSLPSFIYIIGILFLLLAVADIKDLKKGQGLIGFGTFGALVYEFEQIGTNMVFDYGDVVATVLGAIVVYIIFKEMIKKATLNKEDNLTS